MLLTDKQIIHLLSTFIHCDPNSGYGTINKQIEEMGKKYKWNQTQLIWVKDEINKILMMPVGNNGLVVGSWQP